VVYRTRQVTGRALIRRGGYDAAIAADDGVGGVCMNQITGPPFGACCSPTTWKPKDS
jgi:hypothetical protein